VFSSNIDDVKYGFNIKIKFFNFNKIFFISFKLNEQFDELTADGRQVQFLKHLWLYILKRLLTYL